MMGTIQQHWNYQVYKIGENVFFLDSSKDQNNDNHRTENHPLANFQSKHKFYVIVMPGINSLESITVKIMLMTLNSKIICGIFIRQ